MRPWFRICIRLKHRPYGTPHNALTFVAKIEVVLLSDDVALTSSNSDFSLWWDAERCRYWISPEYFFSSNSLSDERHIDFLINCNRARAVHHVWFNKDSLPFNGLDLRVVMIIHPLFLERLRYSGCQHYLVLVRDISVFTRMFEESSDKSKRICQAFSNASWHPFQGILHKYVLWYCRNKSNTDGSGGTHEIYGIWCYIKLSKKWCQIDPPQTSEVGSIWHKLIGNLRAG